jgi:hypothetical protein
MNPFVNPNKRGVELPKGYDDLADILRATKCEYCEDVAIETEGWPGDYRWCDACQRDLGEFVMMEVSKGTFFHTGDESALSGHRAEKQRREADFMRQKVKERKPR